MIQFLSVITSFHEPAASQQIVHEAVERNFCFVSQAVVLQSDVPLVAGPGFTFPPIAGSAPRAGLPEHAALYFFFSTNQRRGMAVFQSDAGAERGTEAAQRGDD